MNYVTKSLQSMAWHVLLIPNTEKARVCIIILIALHQKCTIKVRIAKYFCPSSNILNTVVMSQLEKCTVYKITIYKQKTIRSGYPKIARKEAHCLVY